MDRKTIQEQRKKGYFIDAAMKIIREEGVENLTVKKVANLAGFAPGTLYNYFKDLNELLAYCTVNFWMECKEYVMKTEEDDQEIKEKIIRSCRAYVDYFFNNPNVFKLIFLKDFGEIPEEIKDKFYNPEVVALLGGLLNEGVEEGVISPEKIENAGYIIANFLHGILLFNIMGRAKETKEEMQYLLEENINFILNFC